jgi:hypothetical protein
MKIRFETTIDDIVAFNRFHCENSPMWRRQRLVASLMLPIVLAVLFLLVFVISIEQLAGDPFALAIFAAGMFIVLVLASVPWYFYIRWQMMVNVLAAVRKLLAEGTNHGLIGWRELDLVNDRLTFKMELMEGSYDLLAIEKIVGNDRYAFVYFSSIQAITIPMTLYPEEEYRAFVAELREAWENREAPRPAEEAGPTRHPDERIVEGPV